MGKKLLHTIGYDPKGKPVRVEEVSKGEVCFCPGCGGKLIAHNSGNTGKGSKRPHFAHLQKPKGGCNARRVLHQLFRKQTMEILQRHIDSAQPFPIEWTCPYCSKPYQKDLLQRVGGIKSGLTIDGHRTDLLLTDTSGKPIIGIEILVGRKLTKRTVEHYERNGILLIRIQPTEDDGWHVEEKLRHPDSVGFCSNAECYNFQFCQSTFQREIFAQKFKCKKCSKVVDGYMVRRQSAFGIIGLDNLKDNEKQEIVSKYFRGKRSTVADIVVYGKCRCIPHSKGLVCLSQSALIKETQKGKISKR